MSEITQNFENAKNSILITKNQQILKNSNLQCMNDIILLNPNNDIQSFQIHNYKSEGFGKHYCKKVPQTDGDVNGSIDMNRSITSKRESIPNVNNGISSQTIIKKNSSIACIVPKKEKEIKSILKKSKYISNDANTNVDKVNNNDNSDGYQKPRIDLNGNPIISGSKKHKIQFKERVYEIKIVENWKIYNSDTYEPNKCPCKCNIF